MSRIATADKNKEVEVVAGEQMPAAEKPLTLSDFADALEIPPGVEGILEKLNMENINDKQEFFRRFWDLVADEVVARVKAGKEGPEIDELLDFQAEINKILEKNGTVGDQKEEGCLPGETCQGIDSDETVNLRKKK